MHLDWSPTRTFLMQRIGVVARAISRSGANYSAPEIIAMSDEYGELSAALKALIYDQTETGSVWTMWDQYCHDLSLPDNHCACMLIELLEESMQQSGGRNDDV